MARNAEWEQQLSELRAREAAAAADEREAIVQRKRELKLMMRAGASPPPPSPAARPSPAGNLSDTLGQLQLPSFPTFSLPSEDDATLFAGTVSFGSLMGFCSGYALKKIGRMGATTAGVVFLSLTAAQRADYVSVNWKKIEADTMGNLDLNNDGKVDASDVQVAIRQLASYASDKNSALTAGSFTAGLLLGLRNA